MKEKSRTHDQKKKSTVGTGLNEHFTYRNLYLPDGLWALHLWRPPRTKSTYIDLYVRIKISTYVFGWLIQQVRVKSG